MQQSTPSTYPEDVELQKAVEVFEHLIAEPTQTLQKHGSYLDRIVAVFCALGYQVHGPDKHGRLRGQVIDSYKQFLEDIQKEPSVERRKYVIKQQIRFLKERGYYIAEEIEFSTRQVWNTRRDHQFNALYKKTIREGRSLLGRRRLYVIWQALQNVVSDRLATIEVGVYRGGTSAFIARSLEALEAPEALHYAIDTFEGHRESEVQDFEIHRPGHFGDVSETDVRTYLKKFANVCVLRGAFSKVAPTLPEQRYRFAHVDTDLYRPTLDILEYLLPRMSPGGVIIVDDYLAPKCIGVTRAVHEFLEKRSRLQVWSFNTEQVVLVVSDAG